MKPVNKMMIDAIYMETLVYNQYSVGVMNDMVVLKEKVCGRYWTFDGQHWTWGPQC